MDTVILNTYDIAGGAARAAYRLHQGLRLLKHNSTMIVRDKTSKDTHVYPLQLQAPEYRAERKVFSMIQKKLIDQNRTSLSDTWFSIPYPGYKLSGIELIRNADVINLHWVAQFQSVETIADLLSLGKPVVWTLHDQNPFTGGCHYTSGCEKYKTVCRECSQIKDNHWQIPLHTFENKVKSLRSNLTVVTPSHWLARCAKESLLFKDLRIEVIPNSIETDTFSPQPKEKAKKELGLPPEAILLLFGAEIQEEKRKGFSELMEAMHVCLQNERFKTLVSDSKVKVLTFGTPQRKLWDMAISVKSLGYVKDDAKLALAYSAADICVLPSLEENLPNNMLESMACGTPVVGFEIGGVPDLVQHGFTGYLAPGCNSEKLGEVILALVFDENKRKQMSLNCRQVIEEGFRLDVQAGKYLKLYEDLLPDKKTRKAAKKCVQRSKNGDKVVLRKWETEIRGGFRSVYENFAEDLLRNGKIPVWKPGSGSWLGKGLFDWFRKMW